MDRRLFLKWIGKGIIGTSGFWLYTRNSAWGKSAFDYALELKIGDVRSELA
jgi:hypothetical protein